MCEFFFKTCECSSVTLGKPSLLRSVLTCRSTGPASKFGPYPERCLLTLECLFIIIGIKITIIYRYSKKIDHLCDYSEFTNHHHLIKIITSNNRHLQVFQETAVLHQLGDYVDRLLLRTHCVQLDQPGRIHGESTIVFICVMFNSQQIQR